MKIEYTEMDEHGLDLTVPLRQKIIEYHKALSPSYFYRRYAGMDVNRGNQIILEKAIKGGIRVDLARDVDTGEVVGYCISTISGDRQGEIESIYIEPDYRGSGIGDNLMKGRYAGWTSGQSLERCLGLGPGTKRFLHFTAGTIFIQGLPFLSKLRLVKGSRRYWTFFSLTPYAKGDTPLESPAERGVTPLDSPKGDRGVDRP